MWGVRPTAAEIELDGAPLRSGELVCCGGHAQPSLCPSDRTCRPESERGVRLAERVFEITMAARVLGIQAEHEANITMVPMAQCPRGR
jgi:hypothetical protein